jgi:dUTP pyrophosphatase
MTELKVYKNKENATLPSKATTGSACFDVQAAFEVGDKIVTYNSWNKQCYVPAKIIAGKVGFQLHPNNRVLVPTGLIFDVPEGHVLKMYVRSSVALKKGLVMVNGVGVIDSDYVDESYILLQNISDSLVVIEKGERLAQVELQKLDDVTITETTVKPVQKTDRNGGFGSTGI